MHISVEPSILCLGTPVVLLSTLNADGTANLAPMSSAWWLGWNCMLGLGAKGHTAQNLLREKECVLKLSSPSLVERVNRLAKLTGSDPVPPATRRAGVNFPDLFVAHRSDMFNIRRELLLDLEKNGSRRRCSEYVDTP